LILRYSIDYCGMWWRDWSRHSATSRRWRVRLGHRDFSGHIISPVTTQPLTEINTRNFCWG